MSKPIKISIICPHCSSKLAVKAEKQDVGAKKQTKCPNCKQSFQFVVPESLASMFESDTTKIGDSTGEFSVLLETVPNSFTEYQSFELTAEYYTIGRKNNGGPEHRPDVEVATLDKMMSRKHAAIARKGKTGFVLKDITSKNGIVLNDEKLQEGEEVYLNDGDTFRLGQTQFSVSIVEQQLNNVEESTR